MLWLLSNGQTLRRTDVPEAKERMLLHVGNQPGKALRAGGLTETVQQRTDGTRATQRSAEKAEIGLCTTFSTRPLTLPAADI